MENLNKLSDDKLVCLYMKGNNEAFDAIIRRYESKVFSYIAYSIKNQELAEDIFQDTFVKAIYAIQQGKYAENGKFSSWIMRIAHNALLDYYRTNKGVNIISNDESEVDLFNDPSLAAKDNVEHEMIDRQTLRELRALVAMLPDNQREVVLMRYYKDLSFKEIADITNVSINTALGRMRYALINLRKLAREYEVEIA